MVGKQRRTPQLRPQKEVAAILRFNPKDNTSIIMAIIRSLLATHRKTSH